VPWQQEGWQVRLAGNASMDALPATGGISIKFDTSSTFFRKPVEKIRVLLKYKKIILVKGQSKCDGTRAETGFSLSTKRTIPFKSAGATVQSTTGSRGVRIRSSIAGYTMFQGSVKGTGYPLHSPVSPSLPLPCVTVCHHISTGVYVITRYERYEFASMHVAKCFKPHHFLRAYHTSRDNSNDWANKSNS
jgi:hypothetical protein